MLSRAPSSSFNGPSSSQSHLLAMGLLPFFFVVPLGGKEKRVRTGNKKFQPWFVASFRLTRERGRGWRPTQVKEANTDDESWVLFFLNLARSTVFFFLSFFLSFFLLASPAVVGRYRAMKRSPPHPGDKCRPIAADIIGNEGAQIGVWTELSVEWSLMNIQHLLTTTLNDPWRN